MEAIIYYLLKSVGVLAIFFFSYQLFLKKETFFKVNRHYLLAGIIASLLLPLVIFTKHVYVEPVAQTFDPNLFFSNVPVTYEVVETTEPFNWFKLATYIYALGVLVFGIRFLVQITSLLQMFRSNNVIRKDGFKLIEIEGNISPFSFFNYIVYNPKTYNDKDLTIIINHEKAHGNQLHSIDILLSQIFLILQWFNPLAWLYKKSIQQNLEFMADQFAISKMESAKHYQHTLLKASLKPQYASITNNFYNSLIKKRIIMLNQSKSNIKNAWKYFVIFPALALFLMSFNVETVEVVKESEPTEFNTSSEFTFFIEDNNISNVDQPKASLKAKTFSNKLVEPETSFLQKIIEAKITKNTSDQQLKEIKESLKNDGIEFTYKNVKRNAENEIIGIEVTYKDSDGNTGNYALSSDNAINSFYFFKNEEGGVGFKSENIHPEHRMRIAEARELSRARREEMIKERKEFREQHKEELMKERELMMKERKERMEEQRAMSEEQRKEIKIRMKEARKAHEKVRKEHEEQRKIIIKERIKLHDSLQGKHGNIFILEEDDDDNIFFAGENKPLIIVDGKEGDEKIVELMSPEDIAHINVFKGEKAFEMYGDEGRNGVLVIKTKPHLTNEFKYRYKNDENDTNVEVFVDPNIENVWVSKYKSIEVNKIDKNTTDNELKKLKTELKSKNIDFNYGKVKRNKDGEIMRIKISLDDNKGDKTSATFNHSNKNIPDILFGRKDNNLFIKSN